MNTVYLNGEYIPEDQAKISVFDRGFLFGDSVYEVIPFYQGVGFRLQEHIDRLNHSLRAVRISCEMDWAQILGDLVEKNGGGNLSVYLQITRGDAGKRSHVYDEGLQPTVFACCSEIKDIWQAGADDILPIKAMVMEDLRWHRCDIKSTCLLPNILVLQQANDEGVQEAILSRDDRLTEGSACNLFLVKRGVLFTPKRSSEILGGITRELILELADEYGIQYQEVDVDYDRLLAADEVWVSSSTRGIIPVIEVDGHQIGDGNKGPMWHKMFELFVTFQRKLMRGTK
ncbi:aminotransferase class IV [Neptuniibacter sp.]|uniref:aminotransferase class IV n=1 Tax=Neptuniibacter sp. TaxID=1962643 RepID=UPI00260C794C|nr:aminotransferase class IV [Neptuniibacter sp.]MCP4598470.1 D-alanine aminotransferase [Neptuniibacter sp.]